MIVIPELSEAIRLGSMVISSNRYKWLTRNKDGTCSGCGVGAALYAVGVQPEDLPVRPMISDFLAKYWPWTKSNPILPGIATVIFNRDGFEGLAKYIESIEPVKVVPETKKEEVCELSTK